MSWTAQIMLSCDDDGMHHLSAVTESGDAKNALNGAGLIFDAFTRDHETFIRADPEVNTETDFNSKVTRSRGYTRFSFRLEDGPHHQVERTNQISFGEL